MKALHKSIMLSQTYQLASEGPAANAEIDGANDFLSRFNRQRMDAEQLRDTMLQLTGELQPGPGGPHPFPHMGTWAYMQHGPFAEVYDTNRRAVYLMTQRIQRHPTWACSMEPMPPSAPQYVP